MKSYTLGLQSRQTTISTVKRSMTVSASHYTPKLGGCKPGPLCLWSWPPAQTLLVRKRCKAWRLHSSRFRLMVGLAQKLYMTSGQFRLTFSPRSHEKSRRQRVHTQALLDTSLKKEASPFIPLKWWHKECSEHSTLGTGALHCDCEGGWCFIFPNGAREFNDAWTGRSCYGILISGTHVLWE